MAVWDEKDITRKKRYYAQHQPFNLKFTDDYEELRGKYFRMTDSRYNWRLAAFIFAGMFLALTAAYFYVMVHTFK